jgi:hypothetical protein
MPDEYGRYTPEDLERMASVGQMSRTWNTQDQVREGRRDEDGVAFKTTKDQLGHETTEHADGRRDVTIHLP